MIKYRPHRSGLAESLAESKEFETIEDMFAYIEVSQTNLLDYFKEHKNNLVAKHEQRISISDECHFDERCNWNTRYICSYGNCIGMCDIGEYELKS